MDAETGEPVSFIEVEAGPYDEDSVSWTDTDRNGNYTLIGIPDGLIEIEVGGDGYVQTYLTANVVGAEAVTGVDLSLSRGATISGRVTDAHSGSPLAGVMIEAEDIYGEAPDSEAETDSEGRYLLEGLAQGTYHVWAEGDSRGYIQQYYDDEPYWDDADPVTVIGTQPVTEIDFTLEAGASISGRVVDAETRSPVAFIEVEAGPYDEDIVSWTDTDHNGNYTLKGIPDGLIEIEVDGQGYITERINVSVSGRKAVTSADFGLKRGATISGRVTDADSGSPIAGVTIEAEDFDGEAPEPEAETDSDGRYLLEGLAPGTYYIMVSGDSRGYIHQYYDDKPYRRDADRVTIFGTRPVEGVDFVLALGASISGRVVDARTGLPIGGMEVIAGLVDEDHLAWTDTDSNGGYTLTGIPDGVIEIEVSGQGYIEVRRTVTVRDGSDLVGVDF